MMMPSDDVEKKILTEFHVFFFIETRTPFFLLIMATHPLALLRAAAQQTHHVDSSLNSISLLLANHGFPLIKKFYITPSPSRRRLQVPIQLQKPQFLNDW